VETGAADFLQQQFTDIGLAFFGPDGEVGQRFCFAVDHVDWRPVRGLRVICHGVAFRDEDCGEFAPGSGHAAPHPGLFAREKLSFEVAESGFDHGLKLSLSARQVNHGQCAGFTHREDYRISIMTRLLPGR
jgi:hypothetical protein